MASITPFIPSNVVPFSFAARFDGAPYNITTTWNVSAQRYYVNVYGTDGSWIITIPLIQSPASRLISTAVFDPFLYVLNVQLVPETKWPVPVAPGGLFPAPGTIVDYTLEGFSPSTYNGLFRGMHINETLFTVPMKTNPGLLVISGVVSRKLNMIAPVFKTSTLIYRNGAFEVDP